MWKNEAAKRLTVRPGWPDGAVCGAGLPQVEEWEGYDALVSVGVFEHVGAERLLPYFELADRLLRPGASLPQPRHCPARPRPTPSTGPNFRDTYVFPDNVYQALLVRPDARGHSGLPLTRADWYAHKT